MSKYTEKGSCEVWNHKAPLYSSVLDKYFFSVVEIYEYFEDVDKQVKQDFESVSNSYPQLCNYLELYICKPVHFPELQIPEFLYEELPDGYNDIYDVISPDHPILQKIDELNNFIADQKYLLWYEPSRVKPVPHSLAQTYQNK